MKITITQDLQIRIRATVGLDFEDDVVDKVKQLVLLKWKSALFERTPGMILVTLPKVPSDRLNELCTAVYTATEFIAKYGADADLLNSLLERHGIDRSHPRANSVIAAFENLARLTKQVAKAPKNVTQASPEDPDEQPEEPVKDRAEFREDSLSKPKAVIPDAEVSDPVLPAVYELLADPVDE